MNTSRVEILFIQGKPMQKVYITMAWLLTTWKVNRIELLLKYIWFKMADGKWKQFEYNEYRYNQLNNDYKIIDYVLGR